MFAPLLSSHLLLAGIALLLVHNARGKGSADREAFLLVAWALLLTAGILAVTPWIASAALTSVLVGAVVGRAVRRPAPLEAIGLRGPRSRLVWEEELPTLLEEIRRAPGYQVVALRNRSRAHRVYEGLPDAAAAAALARHLVARSMEAPGRTLTPIERLQRWQKQGVDAFVPILEYRPRESIDVFALFPGR